MCHCRVWRARITTFSRFKSILWHISVDAPRKCYSNCRRWSDKGNVVIVNLLYNSYNEVISLDTFVVILANEKKSELNDWRVHFINRQSRRANIYNAWHKCTKSGPPSIMWNVFGTTTKRMEWKKKHRRIAKSFLLLKSGRCPSIAAFFSSYCRFAFHK